MRRVPYEMETRCEDAEILAIIASTRAIALGGRYTPTLNGVELPIRLKPMMHKHKRKQHWFLCLSNIMINDTAIGQNSIANLIAGAIRRQLRHKDEQTGALEVLPRANIDLYTGHLLRQFRTQVVAEAKTFIQAANIRIPLTFEEYAESMPNQKKPLYRAHVEKSRQKKSTDKKNHEVQPRVKAEKKVIKPDLIHRIFGAFLVTVNIWLGVFLKPLEHHLFKAIDVVFARITGGHATTVMKGMNSLEKGKVIAEKWFSFHKPLAIELDCTHFDKHINRTLLKLEHQIYLDFYSGRDKTELAKLLKRQRSVQWSGFSDDGYRIRYKTSGGRVSGSVNTAMGNISVMCMVFYTYAIRLQRLKIKFEYVNEGDDCFFIIEQADRHRIPDIYEHFIQFGLRVRIENEVTTLNKIQFCQTSPILIDGQWRMIRLPKAVFFKDVCQLTYKSMAIFQKWLYEVGVGGAILNAGVPVLSKFYEKLKSLGVNNPLWDLPRTLRNDLYYSGLTQLIRRMEFKDILITEDARYQFYLTTGLHPDKQLALEELIEKLELAISQGPLKTTSKAVSYQHLFSQLLSYV